MSPVSADRRGRSWAGTLALLSAAALVAAVVHSYMWFTYLPSFNTQHTLLEGVPHARSAIAPPGALSRRLVVVILDGVQLEHVDRIAALAPLRGRGVLRGLAAPFPTFTSPALVSFVTGVVPRDSGVRLNGASEGTLGLDSLTAVATDAGVRVSIRSRGWKPFQSLVHAGSGTDVRLGGISYLLETLHGRAEGALAAPLPAEPSAGRPATELRLVYVGEPDDMAHEHGLASPEYAASLELAGAVVARAAAALDLRHDTLVVLSDHGHRPEGGHGGVEPEVMRAFFLAVGPRVRQGVMLADRPVRDVASTLAALAGLPSPSSNTGRPMLDALELVDEEHSKLLAGHFDQASRFLCALAPHQDCDRAPDLVARLSAGQPLAWPEAEIRGEDLFMDREAALDSATRAARARRVGASAALCAALVTALWVARRRVDASARAWLAALPLMHVALYAAALWARGYRPTFSTIPAMSVFLRDSFLAAGGAALVVSIIAVARRAGALAPWVLLAGTALPFLVLASWVGSDPRTVPPPVTGLLVFYTAPAILFGAIGAGVLEVAGVIATRRSRGS